MNTEFRIRSLEEEVKKQGLSIYVFLGVIFCLLGGLINVLTLSLNDGRMPVLTNYYLDTDKHFSTDGEGLVHPYLIDRFPLRIFDKLFMFSLGDFIIALGVFISLFSGFWLIGFDLKTRFKYKREFLE